MIVFQKLTVLAESTLQNYSVRVLVAAILALGVVLFPTSTPERRGEPISYFQNMTQERATAKTLLDETFYLYLAPDTRQYSINDQLEVYLDPVVEPKTLPRTFSILNIRFDLSETTNECPFSIYDETGNRIKISCNIDTSTKQAIINFPEPQQEGIYRVSFSKSLSSDFYYHIDSAGQRWLQTRFASKSAPIIFLIYQARGVLLAGFIVILVFMLSLLVLTRLSLLRICAAILILVVSHQTIFPSFAGHDETAHVDMLDLALRQEKTVKFQYGVLDFYKQVSSDLVREGFYQLNDVHIKPADSCPHFVLMRCGKNEPTFTFYKMHAWVADLVFSEIASYHQLVMLSKVFNLVFLGGALLLVLVVWGQKSLKATLVSLGFFGGFFAQLPSVTNDIPLFCLGLLFLAAIGHLISSNSPKNWWYACLSFVVFPTAIYGLQFVDRSWLTAVPIFVFLFSLWVVRLFRRKVPKLDSMGQSMTIASVALIALAAILLFVKWPIASIISDPDLREDIKTFFPLYENLSPIDIPTMLAMSLKSFLGSYVWGHFYYPMEYYFLWTTLLICATLISIKSDRSILIPISYAVWSAIFLGFVLLLYLTLPGGLIDANFKVRFLAPVAGIISLPIWLTVFQGGFFSRLVTKIMIGWVILNVGYFLPKFYIINGM